MPEHRSRTLLDGSIVSELSEPKILTVKTKCPQKWKLYDLETGEVYIGYDTEGKNSWMKVDK
jgi:hypothetical protein